MYVMHISCYSNIHHDSTHTYVKSVVFLKRRDVIAANLTLVHSKLHTMYVAAHDVTNQSHTMSMLDLPREIYVFL